ncbi:hypothetical protein BC937DRAFT_90774 [Endogone sp. FLAS-F59071]|nr:hypothetical protein BC937DRAFT_90774 [Endogone sp. FLAS-F59071]|eukprot:RUS16808.1 hypothetical protein BC937DRAFT_90774 [Endogone sp. FLAS-F59071]
MQGETMEYCKIEGGPPLDDSIGCQNHQTILDMQTSLGKLCQVDALVGDGWPTFKMPKKMALCRFIALSCKLVLSHHLAQEESIATTVDAPKVEG